MHNSRIKFVLTEELNRLARWLRLLGYDSAVYKSISKHKLITLAVKEKRTLLTRDKKLAKDKRVFPRILISNVDFKKQIRELIPILDYSEEALFSRCMECNKPLYPVRKDNIRTLVPEFVFSNFAQFKLCRRCGRIYWQGSHYQKMKEDLQNLFC
jgi:hypothetical protein